MPWCSLPRSLPLMTVWNTGYRHTSGTVVRMSGGVRLTAPGLRAGKACCVTGFSCALDSVLGGKGGPYAQAPNQPDMAELQVLPLHVHMRMVCGW
ncbi:hypothetical protein Strop_0499 [Salinispora tropica CNB-440]|uniref:Uncharacterized protein n=1 Tax=Salinispora tropica (strain ATCC BAA-916 / DSM 44818 / JCM 13857 / NBRC 105044 / CNB-440) TaxID=369723 RepID=A4X284_SALTO|nr:hypothetical protein Strop_0499 [Salinispora tropica CNB-440]